LGERIVRNDEVVGSITKFSATYSMRALLIAFVSLLELLRFVQLPGGISPWNPISPQTNG
jgi:hypothetical protein